MKDGYFSWANKIKGVRYSNCHGKHEKLNGRPVMNQTLIAGFSRSPANEMTSGKTNTPPVQLYDVTLKGK